MMYYTHEKFQGSRLSRTEINSGGGGLNQPPRLPRASNTLGLIGLKTQSLEDFQYEVSMGIEDSTFNSGF